MKKTKKLLLAMVWLVLCSPVFAQDKLKIKFGKITPADFVLPDSAFLKNADAVVIADVGATSFEGNSNGFFSLVYKRHVRIKINNANGIKAADFAIPMYFIDQRKEKVDNLKGITYNLEGDKVVETELKNNVVFEDKLNKKVILKKFSMPGVKAGAIVDVMYTIVSDFLTNLQPWEFQGEYPRLWSEYEVGIPEYFNYVFLSQGYHPFTKTANERQDNFRITLNGGASQNENISLQGRVMENKWVMKNIPALKEEPFTSTLDNHIAKIEFQLNQIQLPQQMPQFILGNWPQVVEEHNKSEYFGLNLYKANNWLDDDIKKIVGTSTDTLEKMRKIYAYVRDNFTCTQHSGTSLQDDGLRGLMKRKNGTAGEINLLLTAMINHENITAYPVLLSTRSHGITHEIYPLMDRYNYTVCVVLAGEKEYFLDASEQSLGFNHLPLRCFNGQARVITGAGIPIQLSADDLNEKTTTLLNIVVSDSGKWEGSMKSTLGYYHSLAARERIKDKGKEGYFKDEQKSLPEHFGITTNEFENLDDKDQNLIVKYDFAINGDKEDLIYINPMLGEGYKENPFKSAERSYPVEMSFAQEEIYIANIEIPAGYKVDDLPKSAKVRLNDDDGYFEFIVANQDGKVMLRSKMVIKKANFEKDDYQTLREFYGYIVKKHSEQVVLKKI